MDGLWSQMRGDVRRNTMEEGDAASRIADIGKALSDPVRVRMLEAMVGGRSCCALDPPSSKGVPGTSEPTGICVCEFQEQFGMAQSRVSYHLRVLKDAGVISEETRGKWTFYSLHKERLREFLEETGGWLEPR
jgi:ArsR family transcriptional regulator, arsenate/arsenite/antimonite-responsive transcriptional repressor